MQLTNLTRHPEFAMVRAGAELGTGLRWFNHKLHLRKVDDKVEKGDARFKIKGCEACHERSSVAPAFNPISFARHCATCHEEDLSESAGTLPAAIVAALGPLPRPLQTRSDPDDPGRQAIVGLKHADPWVLRIVNGLRSTADPEGVAAERLTLDRQVAQLELMRDFALDPARAAAWTGLDRMLPTLVDRPPQSVSGSLEGALRDTIQAVESFAKGIGELGAQDGAAQALANYAGQVKQAVPAVAERASSPAPAGLGLAPLQQLIDATVARAQAAGDQSLVQRASALRARLAQLPQAAREQRPSLTVDNRYGALLGELRALADPGVRSEVDRVGYLALLAQQQAVPGIDPTAYDLHRQRTLLLLDAVRQTLARLASGATANPGIEGLLARVDALRQQVLAIYYGVPPDVASARARFFRDRQIERARVDSGLDAVRLRLPAPAPPVQDQTPVQRRLDQLRGRLGVLGSAPMIAGAIRAAEARGAIAALLGQEAQDAEENPLRKNRCTLCHELTPAGDQLAPVRVVGGALLVNAAFTHEPHVTDGKNCETCHTGIRDSAAARDLNIPGIANCRTCHAPGNVAANATGCEACHKYHAPPRSAFMWIP